MLECLKRFEKLILVLLLGMMMLVVLLSTVELGYIILKDILSPPVILLEIEELLEIFGFFLLVLIGIELLETLKAYFIERVVHAEIVLMVAMIAIGRKVITLDVKELSPQTLLGIGAIMVALAIAYYIVRWDTRLSPPPPHDGGPAARPQPPTAPGHDA
ncbi:MAG: phosphate-starvation-inducible PsiE family protein [Candidatus Methylomirabilota bacterium]